MFFDSSYRKALFPPASAVVHFDTAGYTHGMILDDANRTKRNKACAFAELLEVGKKSNMVLNIIASKRAPGEEPVERMAEIMLEDCEAVRVSTGMVRKGFYSTRNSSIDTLAKDLHFWRYYGIAFQDHTEYYHFDHSYNCPDFEGKQRYIVVDISGLPTSIRWTGAPKQDLNARARSMADAFDARPKSVQILIVLDAKVAKTAIPHYVRRCTSMQKRKDREMREEIRAREIEDEIAEEQKVKKALEEAGEYDDDNELFPCNRKRKAQEMEADRVKKVKVDAHEKAREELWKASIGLGTLIGPLAIHSNNTLDIAGGNAIKKLADLRADLRKTEADV